MSQRDRGNYQVEIAGNVRTVRMNVWEIGEGRVSRNARGNIDRVWIDEVLGWSYRM